MEEWGSRQRHEGGHKGFPVDGISHRHKIPEA